MRARAPNAAIHLILRTLVLSLIVILSLGCGEDQGSFEKTVIDASGPRSPWGKSVGDVDGDGDLDILIGGNQIARPSIFTRVMKKLGFEVEMPSGGELVWYENPGWRKHLISENYRIRTDLEVGDLNGDGLNDIVALTNQGVVAFSGPDWVETVIDQGVYHDLELSDLDNDGMLDVVVRDQTLFGHERGDELVLFWNAKNHWRKQVLPLDHGEGLKVADVNRDGYADIVVNRWLLVNPGRNGEATWSRMHYSPSYTWPDVYIDVADVDQDGWPDILLSPSEPAGFQTYRISWLKNPQSITQSWQENVVDAAVETVHHFVGAGDWDGDGDVDVFAAEMNQGIDTNEVKVYLNGGGGREWHKRVLGLEGSHSMRVADFDGDMDVELVGANWHIRNYEGNYAITLWNGMRVTDSSAWKSYEVGDLAPQRLLFVLSEDLDQDGFNDIVVGPKWFRNPGRPELEWSAHEVGPGFSNIVAISDFTHDGRPDLLGTRWNKWLRSPSFGERIARKLKGEPYPGSQSGNAFVWAVNQGEGHFELVENISVAQGDYLQGATVIEARGKTGVALSWHKAGFGVQALWVPNAPLEEAWPWERLSDLSQDEAISVADINRDGLDDLVLGTIWLDQAHDWAPVTITDHAIKPDRNRVADFNRDGWPDIVVGEEAIDRIGKVMWFENPRAKGGHWAPHVVGHYFGPMSLDAGDVDDDGDVDLVVGEHRLQSPEEARLLWLENRGADGAIWKPHYIARGMEHHNGARLKDLDGDNDLDIVSIGWGHSKVRIYMNPAR